MKDFYSCIQTKFFFNVVLISAILLGIFLRLLPHIFMGFSSNLPLNNGGLYLFFSEIIARNNFSYPTSIPFYTEHGIPFAYPPLTFLPVSTDQHTVPCLVIDSFDLHPYDNQHSMHSCVLFSGKGIIPGKIPHPRKYSNFCSIPPVNSVFCTRPLPRSWFWHGFVYSWFHSRSPVDEI